MDSVLAVANTKMKSSLFFFFFLLLEREVGRDGNTDTEKLKETLLKAFSFKGRMY